MFSANQPAARGGRRTTTAGSRFSAGGQAAPASVATRRAVLPARISSVGPGGGVGGGSVNEEQQFTLTKELKKAEDRGAVKSLVKDDVHAVSLLGTLPADVQQLVQESLGEDQVRALIDYPTGFAVVWSHKVCYAWHYKKRSASAPTCYSLPCPDPGSKSSLLLDTLASLPLAALLPHGGSADRGDPGLLLISPSGSLRLWDSVSLSLSGVEKFQSVQIPLNQGEYIRCLEPLGPPASFIVGTSESRLFRVAVFAGVGGKPTVLASAMNRGWRSLAAVGNLFRPTFAADPKIGVLAIATAQSGGPVAGTRAYDVWALEKDRLQRWRVNVGGGEQSIHEADIRQAVLEGLVPNAVDASLASKVQLQYLDIKSASDASQLCLLVSYVDPFATNETTTPLSPRAFALLTLDATSPTSPPIVSSITKLAHRAILDPRPGTSGLLALSSTTSAAFLVLGDAVVAVSREPGSTLEEVVSLKETVLNRVIGFGHPRTPRQDAIPEVSVVTTASGLLKVEINPQALVGQATQKTPELVANLQTAKLKTKLDQAVYYGDDPDNPVAFELRSDYKGDLDAAAQFVSDEILASSSVELAADRSLNIRVKLGGRARYHQSLIRFIGGNGLLGRLSQSTRRHLASNAELLHAALQLWQHQSTRMERYPGASTALASAIATTVEEYGGATPGDDVLRTFFRTLVARTPTVLQHLAAQLKSTVATQASPDAKAQVLEEANEVVLVVYRSVLSYRQAHATTYGLENNPCEAWSSQPALIDVLQIHYDATLDLIRQRSRELGEAVDGPAAGESRAAGLQADLKKQITDLADFLLHMYVEREGFLIRSDAPAATIKALQERYTHARSLAIRGLVEVDRAPYAFKLGEQYRDYRMLVELSHGRFASAGQTQSYMHRFGEDFAFELYHWLIEQGRYKELLDQTPQFSPLLTTFLDATDYGNVSWIQDLVVKRYDHASAVLLRQALVNDDLVERKLMLSIGKLCKVAQADAFQVHDGEVFDDVNGRLDIVVAQENLFDLCKASMPPQLKLQPLEAQTSSASAVLAPELEATRPAFAKLLTRLTRSILEKRALSSEDLVDFCTLKGNHGDQRGHFAMALDIFERADEMAAGRARIALQTIWRRAFLHENWNALRSATSLSDDQVSTCLRETALYFLITHAQSADYSAADNMILTPAQSLFDSTEADVAARFGDQSLGGLGGLMHDYETENAALRAAIDRDGLDDYFAEVVRLAGEGQDGDVSTAMVE